MKISEENKAAVLREMDWNGNTTAQCLTKHEETIRVLLQPSSTTAADEVGEAIRLFYETSVFLMPENKKYKDALNVLINAAQELTHWKDMYAAAETEIDNWEKSYGKLKDELEGLKGRMPEKVTAQELDSILSVCNAGYSIHGYDELANKFPNGIIISEEK